MATVIFNQASIFHLQQLENQYRRRFGERFKLSDEEARMSLIQRSSESTDQIIQKYYRHFCHELEPTLIDELVGRGIVKPPRFK